MPITFESDKDVIVYALEKIISYARDNSYIFLVQSIWWISSVIGLQEGLIIHIDNLKARAIIQTSDQQEELPEPSFVHPDRVANLQGSEDSYCTSDGDSISTSETDIHNEVIENCEAFLAQSQKERKAVGRSTRKASRKVKTKAERKARRIAKKPIKTYGTHTEGIDGQELRRRKAAGECHRCAWGRDRKGSHRTLDCFRWKRVVKGTAPFPTKKQNQN
jgi:hypothetical protein